MRVVDVLENLLTCAEEAIDPPVCRAFKNPGPNAPHDVCETGPNGTDGQLWVAHLTSQPGWPAPTGEPTTCATPFGEQFEMGVTRCAQGKLTDDGGPPDEDLVTADADQQEADRLALRNALLCCLGVEGKDLIIETWEATEPLGGCVGGVWTFTIRDAGCTCDSES